jgi:hypothetical protein
MKKLIALYTDVLPQLIETIIQNYVLFRVQCCR